MSENHVKKPVMLIVMDGWGYREEQEHNAVALAATPNFDRLWNTYPHGLIRTDGLCVGLPTGTMGNSEVGHLNLGAGRVVWQDVMTTAVAVMDGSFFENEALLGAVEHVKKTGGRLHLYGLVSSALIHSCEEVYFALIRLCCRHGLTGERTVFHVFTDGRDTAPRSGEIWAADLQRKLDLYGTGVVGVVSGRYYAMDRDKRWERVEKAWKALVDGEAEHTARSALEAIRAAYERGETDEFITPTLILDDDGKPRGTLRDGDALISFNHRSDRPRELIQAFLAEDFSGFERKRRPNVHLTTMTDYRAGFPVPVAFPSKPVEGSLGELLSAAGKTQLRVAETEKYAHVTFFFSGGREKSWPGEERLLVPSPQVATYDKQPEMSAPELTRQVVERLESRKYDLLVLNYANGDMVGHTGVEEAAIKGVEAVDAGLGAVVETALSLEGSVLITADHGNAEEMWDYGRKCPHTAHTTNPVPVILADEKRKHARLRGGGGLPDVSPTLCKLLGVKSSPGMTGKSLIS